MNDKNIHPDNVQLKEKEKSMEFKKYWNRERIEKAKLLAKKLYNTEFKVVENEELRATRKPEYVVVVEPAVERKEDPVGLPTPTMPKLHIEVNRSCKVFKLRDNTHAPEK